MEKRLFTSESVTEDIRTKSVMPFLMRFWMRCLSRIR